MNNTLTAGQRFVKALEAEEGATRKCLERIPGELYGWKPHEKSMPMGYLALIVAEVPKWLVTMANEPGLDFAKFTHPTIKTAEEMVAFFDANIKTAKEVLGKVSDEDLAKPFALQANGKTLFTLPKIDNIASSIRHWIHHRGQLTVYMRLNNLAVPSLYGPTADENPFK